MAIGGQRDIDDARPGARRRLGAEAQRREPARPIALQEDIGAVQQLVQRVLVVGVAQIELAGPLAAAGVDHQRRDRRQVRRGDQQHVGAMGGQRAPGNRAGDDAGELEHPHAGQRAGVLRRQVRQRHRRCVADPLDDDRRQLAQRGGLRMAIPFVEAAHRRDHHARIRSRGLERLGVPFAQRGLHLVLLIGAAEQAQHAVAVMQEVGVQPDPAAIAATIGARDLVPQLRRGAAIDAQITFAAEFRDGVADVDRDLLPAAGALLPQRRRRQRRRRQARLRGGTDRERRRQHRFGSAQRGLREGGVGQAGGAPQRG